MSEDSLRANEDGSPLRARRKRAPSMPAEDRRMQLIEAAIPLLHRHGSAVTTAQVAEAAGVAEGTIFRLFPDKEHFLDAVLEYALDTAPVLDTISQLALELPARERVLRAADAIRLHFKHALPVMHGAMRHGQSAKAGIAVGTMFHTLLQASEALFAEEISAGRLHGDPRTLARILVGVCQSIVWQEFFERGVSPMPTEQLVSVLLDGCARKDERST